MTANLVDHVLGGGPGSFVGLGGVEVGSTAEKQSSESDEGEGLEDRLGVGQPLERIGLCFLLENQGVCQSDDVSDEDDETPDEEHAEHGVGHIDAQ